MSATPSEAPKATPKDEPLTCENDADNCEYSRTDCAADGSFNCQAHTEEYAREVIAPNVAVYGADVEAARDVLKRYRKGQWHINGQIVRKALDAAYKAIGIDSLRSTLARLSEPSLKVVDAAVEAGDYALKDCDVAKMMEAPGLTAFGVSLAAGVLCRAVTPMLQAAIQAAASEGEE